MKYREIFEKIVEENVTYKELKINYNISTNQLQNAKKYAKRYCPELLDKANDIDEKLTKKRKAKNKKPLYLQIFNYVMSSENQVTNSDIRQKFNIDSTMLGAMKEYIGKKFPERKEEFLSNIIVEHKKNRIYITKTPSYIIITNEILKNKIKRDDIYTYFNITSTQFRGILSNLYINNKNLYKKLKQHFEETNNKYVICHDFLITNLDYNSFLIKHKITRSKFDSMLRYYKINDEEFYNKLIFKKNQIKKSQAEQIINYVLENPETACFYNLEKKFDKSDNNIRVLLSIEFKTNPNNRLKIEQVRKILKNNEHIDNSKYTKLIYLIYDQTNVDFILKEIEEGSTYFQIASILNVRASEVERFVNTKLKNII